MKIGILTLPVKTNYGGILQAYALQAFLKRSGHDAWLIRRRWNSESYGLLHRLVKAFYHAVLIRKFNRFIDRVIRPQTEVIESDKDMRRLNARFDAFVVGSDQVWRMRSVSGIGYNFFLDFADDDRKKIAYAASFGVGYWDDLHSEVNVPIVKRLMNRMDFVSVREESGVDICHNLFGVSAFHVIDPTMLLKAADYCEAFHIVEKENPYMAVYLLDDSQEKEALVYRLAAALRLKVKYINQGSYSALLPKMLKDQLKPGVLSWMEGMASAGFVLTDSFHGTVFSILFHKQFYSVDNAHRGSDRFSSLLGCLGLSYRLIQESADVNPSSSRIDYAEVDRKLDTLRIHSSNLLLDSLR